MKRLVLRAQKRMTLTEASIRALRGLVEDFEGTSLVIDREKITIDIAPGKLDSFLLYVAQLPEVVVEEVYSVSSHR